MRTSTRSAGTRGAIRTRSSRHSVYLARQSGREGGRRRSAARISIESAGRKAALPSLDFDPRAVSRGQPGRGGRGHRSARAFPRNSARARAASRSRRPSCSPPNGFDYVYYLQHNPDVAAAGVDPFLHFQTIGWKEGRNPNALFDTNGYLATYADVKAAGINPLDHYHQFGWHEGRDPVGRLRHDLVSRGLSGRGGRARRSAGALPRLRHARGPLAFADGVWG